jgi:hypothetical protein
VRKLDELLAKKTQEEPDIDFTAKDGVRHTSWVIADAPTIQTIEQEFGCIPFLYIADGHHRSAAAARVFQSRKGAGHSASFLSVIFPHNQMQILPYNRVLKDLNGNSAEALLKRLDSVFIIKDGGAAQPSRKHELGFYLGGRWRDELNRVGERLDLPDLRRLLGSLARTDAVGSSLSEEVAHLASDVREVRRAAAAQRARTAPVKMLFPLVFLVLPAFLLLTVVPVLLTTVRSIS